MPPRFQPRMRLRLKRKQPLNASCQCHGCPSIVAGLRFSQVPVSLRGVMSSSRSLTPHDASQYDLIEAAVRETERGRWFLEEYARRNRNADTDVLLGAIHRLESAVTGDRGGGDDVVRFRGDLMDMADPTPSPAPGRRWPPFPAPTTARAASPSPRRRSIRSYAPPRRRPRTSSARRKPCRRPPGRCARPAPTAPSATSSTGTRRRSTRPARSRT